MYRLVRHSACVFIKNYYMCGTPYITLDACYGRRGAWELESLTMKMNHPCDM